MKRKLNVSGTLMSMEVGESYQISHKAMEFAVVRATISRINRTKGIELSATSDREKGKTIVTRTA